MHRWINGLWIIGVAAGLAGCAAPVGRPAPMAPYRPSQTRMIGPPGGAGGKASAAVPTAGTNRVAVAALAAEDQSRRLQAGDRLEIHLRAIPNPENMKSVVDENGTLNFPFIGAIKVVGLTCSEAERLVEKAYVDGGIYRHITVIIVPPESEYAVQGEVLRPGPYPLSRDMTLMQALSRAGRFTEFADATRVKLIRGKETLEINVKRIEQNKEKDIIVKPGDVILVPKSIW